ncbi:MAG TPA: hypothetical protein VIJ34_13865 [Acidimicrobiales bacterium]
MATVHAPVVDHPYALAIGFVLALVSLRVSVRPPKKRTLQILITSACDVGIVEILVWVFVPARWFGLAATGAGVVVSAVLLWWWKHQSDRPDGDDDVPQRPNPKKKGPTPKKGSNAAIRAKKVEQKADTITNVGQQNNYAAPPAKRPTSAAIYVEGGSDNVISDNEAYGFDTPYVGIGGTRNKWLRNKAVAPPRRREEIVPPDEPEGLDQTAELMDKLLQAPKEEADEVHRQHGQS